MPFETHPDLELPAPVETIWRYMDFTKFVDLLDSRKLFFSNLCKLEDPYEGLYPSLQWERMKADYSKVPGNSDVGIQRLIAFFSQNNQNFKKISYVNCWHISPVESAAMWKVYCKSNEGIAIKSDVSRLQSCFDVAKHRILIGAVRYVDYNNVTLPLGQFLYPVVHKRLSFQYEKELRAIFWDVESLSTVTDWATLPMRDGEAIEVVLEKLIESVWVAPTTPDWFKNLVESVCKRYGFSGPVHRSTVDRGPV